MIKYTDLVKSITLKVKSVFPENEVYALNPNKREFVPNEGAFYVMLEPATRATTLHPYERKITLCTIYFKVHEKNNFKYYDILDKLRYEVLNYSIKIDPKIFDTTSIQKERWLLPQEVKDKIIEDMCNVSFVFDFEDQYYIEPDMPIAEKIEIKI